MIEEKRPFLCKRNLHSRFEFHHFRDGILKRREFGKFRKRVKRISRNKVCARHFWKYCDLKSDGRLTRSEWTQCLGLDTNSKLRYFENMYIWFNRLALHFSQFFFQFHLLHSCPFILEKTKEKEKGTQKRLLLQYKVSNNRTFDFVS